MGSLKVYINTDSQIVINAVKRNMIKDILNLVEDIKWLSVCFNGFVLDYCCRNDNREDDVIVKKVHV